MWLRVVPLGGLGHIGGNMMVYETERDLMMVDCGVLFPHSEHLGIDYLVPDITYVLERRHKLRGMVLTHGHEDHIGALPYVLPQLPMPLYGTAFTAALVRNKLAEFPEISFEMNEIRDRQVFNLGDFTVDPLAVTHSIPQSVALALGTPIGTVVHTGDFKLDPDPLDGRCTDIEGLRAYGDAGVGVLLSDSTNAEMPGRTCSEREVEKTLHGLIQTAPQRVFVTTFASHMDRIQMVLDAAREAGRKVIAVGRSMQQNMHMALEQGFLKCPGSVVGDVSEFAALKRSQVVVLASGSQGEAQSSMARLAEGRLTSLRVEEHDWVILSSRHIPGNERAIAAMVNNFCRQGARVIEGSMAHVHSSGHGFNDEQREMIEACRPCFFVPLHGEYRHMVRHGVLAEQAGIASERVLVTEDGYPLEFCRVQGELVAHRMASVRAGLVFVDGKGIGDIGEIVLRERRILSESGIIVCMVGISSEGRRVLGPQLVSRGLVYAEGSADLLERAASKVRHALDHVGFKANEGVCTQTIHASLRRFFRDELDRKPMIVPVVLRLMGCCEA